MRRETLIKNLLFDVDPVPFEAVVRECLNSVRATCHPVGHSTVSPSAPTS
jgi:hypothetical protein